MKTINKVIAWLNGKKTNIGAIIAVSADIMQYWAIDPKIVNTVQYVAAFIIMGGLSHKAMKVKQKNADN